MLTTGPTPGALLRDRPSPATGALSDHPGEIPSSVSLRLRSSHLMWGEDSPAHGPSRSLPPVSPPSASRRSGGAEPERPTAPGSSRPAGAEGLDGPPRRSGPGSGRRGCPSWRVGRWPWQKSRTCRGFTTATGMPPSASAPAKGIISNPGGFQDNESGLQSFEAGHEGGDPTQVMGNAPGFAAGTHRHIQLGFGHINANIDARFAHRFLLVGPSLQNAGSSRPTQLFGLVEGSAWRPKLPTVSYDPGT